MNTKLKSARMTSRSTGNKNIHCKSGRVPNAETRMIIADTNQAIGLGDVLSFASVDTMMNYL